MRSLKLPKLLLFCSAVLLLSFSTTSCKKKPKDTDIRAAVEAALKADPNLTGATVEVKDGVATIGGESKDQAAKDAIEKVVAAIKNVKQVVNNIGLAPVAPPPTIAADDPLTNAVNTALKAFPGVSASVKEGVVYVTGKIAKLDRQKLMMALQALKPKRVDVGGLSNN